MRNFILIELFNKVKIYLDISNVILHIMLLNCFYVAIYLKDLLITITVLWGQTIVYTPDCWPKFLFVRGGIYTATINAGKVLWILLFWIKNFRGNWDKRKSSIEIGKVLFKAITNNAFLFLVLQRKLSSKKNPSEIKCLYFPEYKQSSLNLALCNCWFVSPHFRFHAISRTSFAINYYIYTPFDLKKNLNNSEVKRPHISIIFCVYVTLSFSGKILKCFWVFQSNWTFQT